MKKWLLVLGYILLACLPVNASPLNTTVPVLSPALTALLSSFNLLWIVISLAITVALNFLVFRFFCSRKLGKDFEKKQGEKFVKAVAMIVVVAVLADLAGLLAAGIFLVAFFPSIVFSAFFMAIEIVGLLLIVYAIAGFLIIYFLDCLILIKYLKVEEKTAGKIARNIAIILNPVILFILGAIIGLLIAPVTQSFTPPEPTPVPGLPS